MIPRYADKLYKFNSKCCINIALFGRFASCTSCKMAVFADCIMVSLSLVSLAVGKETTD